MVAVVGTVALVDTPLALSTTLRVTHPISLESPVCDIGHLLGELCGYDAIGDGTLARPLLRTMTAGTSVASAIFYCIARQPDASLRSPPWSRSRLTAAGTVAFGVGRWAFGRAPSAERRPGARRSPHLNQY